MPVKDMTGQTFGRLTVIERCGTAKDKQAIWLCRCECGNETAVRGGKLRQALTISCGCLRRERLASGLGRGSSHPSYKGDDVKYGAIHQRVRRAYGSASDHACVDCGVQAKEWSLKHGADPVVGEHGQQLVAYSLRIEDYEPRCRACHRAYDKGGVSFGDQVRAS